MTLARIFAVVDRYTHPLDTEVIPLLSAFGRICARSVSADKEMPPFDISALDGYAVCGRGPSFVVKGEMEPLGPLPGLTKEGTACFVPTGGRLPSASRFVAREHVRETDRAIVVETEKDETRVVKAGDWLRQGVKLVTRGDCVSPSAMALLALSGFSAVTVYRKPAAAIITTGSELKQGKLVDSNRFLLAGLIQRDGGDPGQLNTADDTEDDILRALSEMGRVDIVVLTGGTSKGKRDVTKEAIKQWGGVFHLESPPILPGKTMAFGRRGATAFYILPGNPKSVRSLYELFVKRGLFRLAGRRYNGVERFMSVPEIIEKPADMVTATPVLVETETSVIREMYPLEPNGFVVLDEGASTVRPGELVKVILV
jgi:molybdopterin molybdotransferase